MRRALRRLPDWAALAGALALLCSAAVFTLSARSRASESIQRLTRLGTSLTEVSLQARESARTAPESHALTERKHDLELRITECAKPSLVAAQITENTRNVGASVVEIKPLDVSRAVGPTANGTAQVYPKYRVSILGSYQQLAEFMKRCTRQRLPVRIAELILSRGGDDTSADGPSLRADLIVESFEMPRKETDIARKPS